MAYGSIYSHGQFCRCYVLLRLMFAIQTLWYIVLYNYIHTPRQQIIHTQSSTSIRNNWRVNASVQHLVGRLRRINCIQSDSIVGKCWGENEQTSQLCDLFRMNWNEVKNSREEKNKIWMIRTMKVLRAVVISNVFRFQLLGTVLGSGNSLLYITMTNAFQFQWEMRKKNCIIAMFSRMCNGTTMQ